jgi:hypothetical protein
MASGLQSPRQFSSLPGQEDLHFYSTGAKQPVKRAPTQLKTKHGLCARNPDDPEGSFNSG